MAHGFFVTIEGIDGTGKTTLFSRIKRAFEELRAGVHVTKCPGDWVDWGDGVPRVVGSSIGPQIRHMLFKEPTTHKMAPGVADLLFLADQIQCIEEDLRPHLEAGEVILADRFYDSQFAYGVDRSQDSDWWMQLWSERVTVFEQHGFEPGATVLLTIDPELGLTRSSKRTDHQQDKQAGKTWATVAAQTKIQQVYLDRLLYRPRTVRVHVDDRKTPDEVFTEAWEGVRSRYLNCCPPAHHSTGA